MFAILFTKKTYKQYDGLPKRERLRIDAVVTGLRENPFAGKKLDGDLEGYWGIRSWPYRVIYTIEKYLVTVTVVAIGQRKDVYRKLK